MTFGVNAIIFLANLLTGGNYGFLSNPPVIGDHSALVNYLIVTSLMTGILVLINQFVKYKHQNS
ncbi:membrane domain protein [Streptococcus sp. SK140]|nr:membrane domain protein [Streptococcus sp. SK140]